jgi:mRNA interferase MazF
MTRRLLGACTPFAAPPDVKLPHRRRDSPWLDAPGCHEGPAVLLAAASEYEDQRGPASAGRRVPRQQCQRTGHRVPVRGSETSKRRPAVIVRNDGANRTAHRLGRGVINVVPVTSNTARVYPFHVLIDTARTGLGRDSKAQAEQLQSVASERGGERVGLITGDLLTDLDEVLRLHLAL